MNSDSLHISNFQYTLLTILQNFYLSSIFSTRVLLLFYYFYVFFLLTLQCGIATLKLRDTSPKI